LYDIYRIFSRLNWELFDIDLTFDFCWVVWTFFHFSWTFVHTSYKKVQTCFLFSFRLDCLDLFSFSLDLSPHFPEKGPNLFPFSHFSLAVWTFFHFPWTYVHSFHKKVQTCSLFSFWLACLDLFSFSLDLCPHFLEKGPNLLLFLISAWLFGPFFIFLGLMSTLSRKRSKLVSFSHFDLTVWTFFHFSWT